MSPRLPAVGRGVVTVWNVWIGDEPDDQRAREVLSGDELDRAARFVYDLDRNRYIIGRLALRELLAHYLDVAPPDVRFRYRDYGKPELAAATLRFNLAHSDDLAVVGVTEHDRLGVDVERIRELPDVADVARSVFSERELDAFHALPESSKTPSFFRCWTRKEAFVKAVGEGLSHPLGTLDVNVGPAQEAELLRSGGSTAPAGRWSLLDLTPMKGWVGAVAVEHPKAELQHAGWLREPPFSR